ncbi:MAG: molecular chaperone DnaJ [Candidatus Coatesbacteria bacterium]
MAKRDYYDVLGVPRGANEDDIKRAFRTLAKKHHPDANPGDKGAEDRFKEINEAYEVLSDARKRKAYDTFGYDGGAADGGMGARPGAGAGPFGDMGGSGMGDMFEDLLGGFFGGLGGRRRGREPGEDLEVGLELGLEEAFKGGERRITFPRTEICGTCSGSGAKPGTAPEPCKTCGGRGQIHVSQGFFAISRTCPKCRGRGVVIDSPCPGCRGSGRTRVERTLTVNVPAGVDSGMRVRLAGEGEPGLNGGPRGDLYLAVGVRHHELFEREGDHLMLDLPVRLSVAAAGGDVSVPTLEGSASLHVPSGTQPGQVFRMRGQGMPAVNRRSRGDLLVRVQVEVPRRLSRRQAELLRELEADGSPSDYESVERFEEKKRRFKPS